jgi:hypothetical protein
MFKTWFEDGVSRVQMYIGSNQGGPIYIPINVLRPRTLATVWQLIVVDNRLSSKV